MSVCVCGCDRVFVCLIHSLRCCMFVWVIVRLFGWVFVCFCARSLVCLFACVLCLFGRVYVLCLLAGVFACLFVHLLVCLLIYCVLDCSFVRSCV